MRIRRAAAYVWAFPASLVGLALLPLALPFRNGRARWHSGVLEMHGRDMAWFLKHVIPIRGGASAMTFGHVVIGRDAASLARTRFHERVHVRQYERWGIFFYPAYLLSSLWLLARGGDAYRDNPFEREAYEAEAAFMRHPDGEL